MVHRLVTDDFTRSHGSVAGEGAWLMVPPDWHVGSERFGPDTPSLTARVTATRDGAEMQTPWGSLRLPPEAQPGDVIRWTIQGGEITVEINPPVSD